MHKTILGLIPLAKHYWYILFARAKAEILTPAYWTFREELMMLGLEFETYQKKNLDG